MKNLKKFIKQLNSIESSRAAACVRLLAPFSRSPRIIITSPPKTKETRYNDTFLYFCYLPPPRESVCEVYNAGSGKMDDLELRYSIRSNQKMF